MNAQVNVERMREASEWVQRLADPGESERAFVEWQQWCGAHSGNLELFGQMQEVWDGLGPSRTAAAPVSIVTPRRRRGPILAAAASVAALGIAVAWWWTSTPTAATQNLQTRVGEVRQETLPDGSRLNLGADSRVEVRYSGERRDLRLVRGRAYFAVARDPHRPFVVHAGELAVTAVGTAFDIRTGSGSTIVTVGEGRVRIDGAAEQAREPVLAEAGQRVRYAKLTQAVTVAAVDPRLTESWRTGVLQFQEEPLQDVVNEVNRYSSRTIVLNDPQLAGAPFTGTISPQRMDDWFIALEKILPVTVETGGPGDINIVRRASGAQ